MLAEIDTAKPMTVLTPASSAECRLDCTVSSVTQCLQVFQHVQNRIDPQGFVWREVPFADRKARPVGGLEQTAAAEVVQLYNFPSCSIL